MVVMFLLRPQIRVRVRVRLVMVVMSLLRPPVGHSLNYSSSNRARCIEPTNGSVRVGARWNVLMITSDSSLSQMKSTDLEVYRS